MFDTVCTIPLDSDLFCQATHPSEPLLATGLATGHVTLYRLPSLNNHTSSSDEDGNNSDDAATTCSDGRGQIATCWKSRRHKLSCRELVFNIDGTGLFSAGAEGIVKYADTETGKVRDKIAVPLDSSTGGVDAASLIRVLTPQTLLLGTDSSALHVYDLRLDDKQGNASIERHITSRPTQTYQPHTEYVTSLTPLPPSEASTSGFSRQWVSTGGTTLAVTDLRRGVLVRSEDQEELLLSSLAVTGLSSKGSSRSEKIVVGGADGVLTLWERGQWDDQDERIVVDKGTAGTGPSAGGESLDTLRLLPEIISSGGKIVAVGMGDGQVRFVKIGPNKVIGELRHDELEGVVGLDFDVEGRLITGGGNIIKIWHKKVDKDEHAYVGDDSDKSQDSDGESVDDSESDSDNDRKTKQTSSTKRQKLNNGGHLNGTAGNFSFAGLD